MKRNTEIKPIVGIAMNEKKEMVNHPDHYKENGFEVIDIINAYSHVRGSFALGNAVKYILRAGKKGKDTYLEDLKKAIWYLNAEIEYQEREVEKRRKALEELRGAVYPTSEVKKGK